MSQIEHELQRVLHIAMNKGVHPNADRLQAIAKYILCAIRDHQIRLKLDDLFYIRIQQPTDPLLGGHFRGKLIVIANRNHSIAKSEGEKHLGNIRHGGDDALWRRRGLQLWRRTAARGQHDDQACSRGL